MKVGGRRISRVGGVFILSGPSGAGKTSIARPVLERLDHIEFGVSLTTRAPRPGEIDGRDYQFIDAERFQAMVRAQEFAEWAEVHGFRYGTSKPSLERAIQAGRDVLLDIDVQGAAQIKRAYPTAVSVFLLPPSRTKLERRLSGRGTESAAQLARKLANAAREIARLSSYDYVIVNHDLERSVNSFAAIIEAERLRVARVARSGFDQINQVFRCRT